MGQIKALLVGVSNYPEHPNYDTLPYCKNDVVAMKNALIKSLKVLPENIITCGETGFVKSDDFLNSFVSFANSSTPDDIFIFYYSGHGSKIDSNNSLLVSDKKYSIASVIDAFKNIKSKRKIAILDCCYSGATEISSETSILSEENINDFIGNGIAILASCRSNQESGFVYSKKLSRYTSYLCDALSCTALIRAGKISLDSIARFITQIHKINCRKGEISQDPIYRSSILGSIFFEVEKYNPYSVNTIYKETDSYIIYSVESVNIPSKKRISVKVLLRYHSSIDDIILISKEIRDTLLFCDVYNNEREELLFRNRPVNIMWFYFGQDDSDMVNGIFSYRSIWADNLSDRENLYSSSQSAIVIDNICVIPQNSYTMLKEFETKHEMPSNDFISGMRKIIIPLVNNAQSFINLFREYKNHTLSETELDTELKDICVQIHKLYFEIGDFGIASPELHQWDNCCQQLAGSIYDFIL